MNDKKRIQLTCEGCQKVYDLPKTEEIPEHVFFLRCNWCPQCEDQANDYWENWWDEEDNNTEQPIPVPDNQLCFPFIFEEIGIKNKTGCIDSSPNQHTVPSRSTETKLRTTTAGAMTV